MMAVAAAVVVVVVMMMMMMLMIIIIIIIIIRLDSSSPDYTRFRFVRADALQSRSPPYLVQHSVEIRYRYAHSCRSGTIVLPFSRLLRQFLGIVSDLTHRNDEW